MNEFDIKAATWDKNPVHWERSQAIARGIIDKIHLRKNMSALEYGAGTGILSFILKDHLKEIILMDNSSEMIKIIDEKIKVSGVKNLKTKFFNLEHSDFKETNFDFIFTQMVLHHVVDIENIISKFYNLLNPGGYLSIADLFPEDGSFHGDGFTGHNGFDPENLSFLMNKSGFTNISHSKCFVINQQVSDEKIKKFDLFLLTANKSKNK